MLDGADISYDVCADGGFAYVANSFAGMKVLNVTNPATPAQVGSYDTASKTLEFYCVAARDSFAYLGIQNWEPGFRVINVSDRTDPTLLCTCDVWNPAYAVVIRDSLAYLPEDYKLEIFSIANPRDPRLVGSCGLSNSGANLWLVDTLAYVASWPAEIVNVRDPSKPVVIGSINASAAGICVRDTFAYLALDTGGLETWNVANPSQAYPVDRIEYPDFGYDVVVADSLLYFGGDDLRVLNLDDPAHPREIGHYPTPDIVFRLFCSFPYVYAACFSGGVCILETTGQTAVAEPAAPHAGICQLRAFPSPARNLLRLVASEPGNSLRSIKIRDVAGRTVIELPLLHRPGTEAIDEEINIESLPEGCYFVDLQPSSTENTIKFIKVKECN
jgi:hypothetical protein